MSSLQRFIERWLGMEFKPRADVLAALGGAPFPADGYQNFVFQWDKHFFCERVEMIGFTGAKRVMDAGCGLGQMAAALAQYNDDVLALDSMPSMVESASAVCRAWGRTNVTVTQGRLPDLSFPDESFDLIVCAGVLDFNNREAAMRTFARLLGPGGRLYVMTNSRGRWIVKLILGVVRGDRALARTSWTAIWRGRQVGRIPSFLRRRDVPAHCRALGLELVAVDFEGHIDVTGKGRRKPMFPPHFLGLFEQNIEFIARKPFSAKAAEDPGNPR